MTAIYDFTAASLTSLIDSLEPEQVAQWKAASARHARELSSESQVLVWKRAVDRLAGLAE